MALRFLSIIFIAMTCLCTAVTAQPKRIVSTNLCSDQYLIALADRSQIAGLSQFARDQSLSYYYKEARLYPIVSSTAEAILPLKPDLIVGSPSRRLQTRALLRRFGLPIIDIGTDRSFEDIVRHTRMIAAAIGHPERGEALIATMRAELAAVAVTRAQPEPVAVHYQRQGLVTGTNTLMGDMMKRAGLRNLAAQFGDTRLSRVDLETIVAAQPDFILYTNDLRDIRDWGAALLDHPALVHAVHSRRIYVPDNLTVCGGPSFPKAVAELAAQVQRPPAH